MLFCASSAAIVPRKIFIYTRAYANGNLRVFLPDDSGSSTSSYSFSEIIQAEKRANVIFVIHLRKSYILLT